MKYILFSIAAAIVMTFGACDKDSSGSIFDFSDTLQPYIIISKAAVNTKRDSTANIRFTMRTGLSKKVTVTYEVSGGLALGTQTVTIDEYTTSKTVVLDIPSDAPAPSTTTVTLISAVKEDGTPLTIGRYADPTGEKLTINVKAP